MCCRRESTAADERTGGIRWELAEEAELGLELSRSRVRLRARVLILILQIRQSTTDSDTEAPSPPGVRPARWQAARANPLVPSYEMTL